jgi:hypothetical protein
MRPEFAILENKCAVAILSKVMVVGNQNQSLLPFLAKFKEKIHDFLPCFIVQVPGWLIGEYEFWFAHNSSGNRDSLTFTSGKLGRKMRDPVR